MYSQKSNGNPVHGMMLGQHERSAPSLGTHSLGQRPPPRHQQACKGRDIDLYERSTPQPQNGSFWSWGEGVSPNLGSCEQITRILRCCDRYGVSLQTPEIDFHRGQPDEGISTRRLMMSAATFLQESHIDPRP